MALTRAQLDDMVCGIPGCTHSEHPLYLHSRCHPDVPTWARYEDGEVIITCAKCVKVVAVIEVAP